MRRALLCYLLLVACVVVTTLAAHGLASMAAYEESEAAALRAEEEAERLRSPTPAPENKPLVPADNVAELPSAAVVPSESVSEMGKPEDSSMSGRCGRRRRRLRMLRGGTRGLMFGNFFFGSCGAGACAAGPCPLSDAEVNDIVNHGVMGTDKEYQDTLSPEDKEFQKRLVKQVLENESEASLEDLEAIAQQVPAR